jgi:UDP-N-acetylglucosamine 2-epimerase (non-hydrolysing)
MISRMASINFTPHDDSYDILINEKVFGKIINVGNTILDLINSYNLHCSMDNIVLITFHRRENWDKIDDLLVGLKKLISKTPNIKYIWYLHMNPELQKKVKEAIYNIPSIILKEPCNHIEFTKEIAKSNFIITDSGGIQEEASFLGKHCIVLRKSTERTHIPEKYITILENYTLLDNIYNDIPKEHLPKCNVYGYGDSSIKIINYLFENI